jgi:hypothetical protein
MSPGKNSGYLGTVCFDIMAKLGVSLVYLGDLP